MKARVFGLLLAGLLAAPMAAEAALIQVDFTVNGNWFDSGGTPFDMPLSPTLTGTLVTDNTKSGASALIDFSLMTGTQLWTEADFVDPNIELFFDFDGNVWQFFLNNSPTFFDYTLISSHNTFVVYQDSSQEFNACNDCVTFVQRAVPVSEPSGLLLFIGALTLLVRRPSRRLDVSALSEALYSR